ncbi:MAG TPA: hypothetical protein VKD65_15785, partial [Candidatus Angelobacter sp.]|nr:hypothetical protein [Candidatus Angelobacter sp.]
MGTILAPEGITEEFLNSASNVSHTLANHSQSGLGARYTEGDFGKTAHKPVAGPKAIPRQQ